MRYQDVEVMLGGPLVDPHLYEGGVAMEDRYLEATPGVVGCTMFLWCVEQRGQLIVVGWVLRDYPPCPDVVTTPDELPAEQSVGFLILDVLRPGTWKRAR